MLQSEQDTAIADLQERVEQLSVLKWTPGDVIVVNHGVGCPMSATRIREQLRSAFGEVVKFAFFDMNGDDIKLSVIATGGESNGEEKDTT